MGLIRKKGSNLPSTQPTEKVSTSLAAILWERWLWSRNPAPSQTLLYQSFIRLSSGYLHLGISLQSKDTSAICNTTTIQAEFSRTAAEMNCKGAINPLCPTVPSCMHLLSQPTYFFPVETGLLLKGISDSLISAHIFTFPFAWNSFSLSEIYLVLWTAISLHICLSFGPCHIPVFHYRYLKHFYSTSLSTTFVTSKQSTAPDNGNITV